MSTLRTIAHLPRARLVPSSSHIRRRFAHQSYGNDQSGHPTSDTNPRRDVEHPGPDPPDTTGSASKASSSSSNDQPSSHASSKSNNEADKGRPAIHQPESAAEADDPEVRKHNEEMRNRHEVSANQLSEKDNKVDVCVRKIGLR